VYWVTFTEERFEMLFKMRISSGLTSMVLSDVGVDV
jgi:hypothetical protein